MILLLYKIIFIQLAIKLLICCSCIRTYSLRCLLYFRYAATDSDSAHFQNEYFVYIIIQFKFTESHLNHLATASIRVSALQILNLVR